MLLKLYAWLTETNWQTKEKLVGYILAHKTDTERQATAFLFMNNGHPCFTHVMIEFGTKLLHIYMHNGCSGNYITHLLWCYKKLNAC